MSAFHKRPQTAFVEKLFAPPATVHLTYENLTLISGRLFDHASAITNVARSDIANDLRLAARSMERLATLRFDIMDIAKKAPPDIARDLHAALDEAEQDIVRG